MIQPLFEKRRIAAFVALSCTGLLLYAYYTIFFQDLEACTLCLTQQLCFLVIGLCGYVAWIFGKNRVVSLLTALLILLFACLGGGVAGRQIWLQNLPPDQVPACGASLEYMVEVFPILDVLKAMLMGDGNCAEIPWQFLGLSMAGWAVIWFGLLLISSICLIYLSLKKEKVSD